MQTTIKAYKRKKIKKTKTVKVIMKCEYIKVNMPKIVVQQQIWGILQQHVKTGIQRPQADMRCPVTHASSLK